MRPPVLGAPGLSGRGSDLVVMAPGRHPEREGSAAHHGFSPTPRGSRPTFKCLGLHAAFPLPEPSLPGEVAVPVVDMGWTLGDVGFSSEMAADTSDEPGCLDEHPDRT